ncbi:autotransporter outer membrane beta-barrel domain-containing protein [Cetobacterium sp.]|uniref:autotransporter outer membrane beta-barrel domain-containing protein n=1 Tax=Cetobacterium sp. TaxID=2071632 RepID=UPI003EE681E5
MSKKKILLASLLLTFYSIGYSEELKGTIFLETNYLKLKHDKKNSNNKIFNPDIEGDTPSVPEKWVNIWRNKEEIINSKYYEENNSIDVDNSSFGLLAIGENVKIVNNGNINLNKDGIGMAVINNAMMENSISGKIKLNENNEVGMLSTALTTGINKGSINLSGGNNYTQSGMVAENGGTSINDGEIIVSSDNSYGMLGNSNPTLKKLQQTSLINNNNIILNKGFAGIGIESREDLSIGVNKGNILVQNSTSSRGMVSAKGAESINEGTISIVNSKQSFGMNIGDGDSTTGKQTIIRNNKNIDIDSNSTGSIGMRVFKENGYEMDSGLAENFGVINVLGKDNVGILSSGVNTEVLNNKIVFLNGEHNIGIQSNLNGSSGVNNGEIIIDSNSISSFGMVTFTGGSITNNGEITIKGGGNGINVAMQAVDGVALNNANINLLNKNQVGMNAVGTGIADNKGVINIDNLEGSSFGMTVKQGATIINSNKIDLLGTGTAMSNELMADTNVSLINRGNIKIKTNYSSGMVVAQDSNIINEGKIDVIGEGNTAINADTGSIVKTTKDSSITLTGNSNTGISLNNAKLENNGSIIIDGQSNIGIKTNGTSQVINTGTINIVSGEQNKGIVISKNSTLQNTGTIIIRGEDVTSKPSAGRPDKNLGIYNMGTIINSGKLAVSGEFNSDSLGSGSLLMDKNSNLEAEKIKGNIYLSGGITTGSIKDEYSTYKMFTTNKMEANLLSNSLLFDTKLINNDNNYYDAILTRKNFNEIIDDSNLANYLEKNYIADGNLNKVALYDKFKMVSSNQQMNSLLDDTFGKNVFPTLQKQTFEMVRLNNEILKSNILKEAIKEEFKYIVGGAYNKIDSDSSKDAEGYISSLKNIWIGGEKRVTDTLKAGAVLSIGDYNSNFTKNSHRDDRILQGTLFVSYDKENLNMRTFATFGGTKTDLDRESQSYNEKLNSNFDSRYFILSNEISKTFDLKNNTYIVPKASLSLYRLKQDEIRETNGQYAIEIGKVKSVIIEPSVGITLGKNILINNEYNLKPELEFNYFYKTGDLKNNLDGKIKSISDDTFKLNGYQFERNSGDGKLKISLEKKDWNIYASYELIFEDKVSNITTLGINYKFN